VFKYGGIRECLRSWVSPQAGKNNTDQASEANAGNERSFGRQGRTWPASVAANLGSATSRASLIRWWQKRSRNSSGRLP
jgi:hypothetical protein